VGFVGLIIDFGVFNFLSLFDYSFFLASLVSVVMANIWVFFANLLITFGHVPDVHRLRAGVLFGVLALLTIAANNVLVWVGLALLSVSDLTNANLVKLGAVGLLFILRFWLAKMFIYVPGGWPWSSGAETKPEDA